MRGLALGLALVLGAACGYRFTGANARLPAGLTAVEVPLFVNRTAEPNAEVLLTQAFREHYARAGRLGSTGVVGTVEGTILAISTPIAVTDVNRAPVYRLSLTVQVRLLKGGAAVAGFVTTQAEDFLSGGDVLLTEANRAAALRRVAEVVARDAAERLEAF